jgi:hypothetical protein
MTCRESKQISSSPNFFSKLLWLKWEETEILERTQNRRQEAEKYEEEKSYYFKTDFYCQSLMLHTTSHYARKNIE